MDNVLSLLKKDFLILLILGVSNFLPILGRWLMGERMAAPVDLGIRWLDGRPVFGPHKTWRGLILSIAGAGIFSNLTGIGLAPGMKLAAISMGGDLLSSFIKRRRGLRSGASVPLIDQGLESMFSLAILRTELCLTWIEVFLLTGLFILFDIILSPILYRLGVRRNPR